MKAIVITKYGKPVDVLRVKEVAKPIPGDNQVLVKVYAASLNVADLAPIRGAFIARLLGTGWLRPKRKILGTDIAGQVEAVGKSVTQFRPGDEVFGAAAGGLAEYACVAEDRLTLKPANVTFATAAAVPVAGVSAVQGLRKGRIEPGQHVLIHGASGGVGTFAVQLAKSFGAEVTAVCSTRNVDNAHSLGADHVIDYTQIDFTKKGKTYDLILAVNGDRSPLDYRKALSPKGICVVLGGSIAQIFQAMLFGPLVSKAGGQRIGLMGIAKMNQKDLNFLKELLAAGKVKPSIDRRYPFSKTVEAVEYLAEGHARAKIVITMESDSKT
ncbi:MAG: NAD(P)-dependent alcohol dehydrogenase [Chloroflexota bacterium]|nr:NAD(P)-dependent alcohol dehydrogenase [Chloroflexota bacterium]